MQRFGEKLRTLRQQHGLTMRELASELEFSSHSYVGRIETGTAKPSIELVVQVAQFFNVSFDQLMNDDIELD
ncbi:helix-turn-helix transcriptional regulator [Anaerolineales bacterium HSG6]|nr:helix-turn-helix transcriptional regulator [Anaerolineales bacterium HSG6]